jgi:hypothetical protein
MPVIEKNTPIEADHQNRVMRRLDRRSKEGDGFFRRRTLVHGGAVEYDTFVYNPVMENADTWPPLPLAAWADTYATLHMWTQVVGKIRLALAPPVNHWWHVTLHVTPRGLTTRAMPYGEGCCEILFDFVDHRLVILTNGGQSRVIPLEPQSVADFYARVQEALRELRIAVRISPTPVEVPSPIRFDQDREHHAYDAAAVARWWRVILNTHATLEEFRGAFIGKSSPVHFFWGSFDLAVSRFSGRPAPPREGADAMTREAYSHEVSSVGFWPGSVGASEAAFYAYVAPEPPGFGAARIEPAAAFYSSGFKEFLLNYEDVRTSASPRVALLAFARSTYAAGASLGGWDPALVRGERT